MIPNFVATKTLAHMNSDLLDRTFYLSSFDGGRFKVSKKMFDRYGKCSCFSVHKDCTTDIISVHIHCNGLRDALADSFKACPEVLQGKP
jgi:hypothetical protein